MARLPPPRPSGQRSAPPRQPPAAAPEKPSDLPETFFLGRYRVVDEIGVGGMASVHLARADGPGGFQKWVAIKRIHPHLVEDDQFVDMFLDEARIAAGINHANVAQVFDLGKDNNTYWIAMEYLHGEPLREVMRRTDERGSQVPYHLAARMAADAAEGLHGAHELRGRNGQLLNLVHRDVTPHNLFVTYDGYTKVVDFGIAKVIDRLASTRAGTLKGKLAYMSPEQVRGHDVDRRTDIFALGVVLWELTTNRRLFRRETDLDTLEQVQACVVPQPSTIARDYPPELEQVVMKALSRRPEDRFQTAREFSRALQRFLMHQGTFVGPEDVGDHVKELFRDRVEKRKRYLDWAAEVTSAVDIDDLREQQEEGASNAPSLLNTQADSPKARGNSGPAQGYAPPVPQGQAAAGQASTGQAAAGQASTGQASAGRGYSHSQGQASAAAAVVTSTGGGGGGYSAGRPPDLGATSLLDEDDEIPTIVAPSREIEEFRRSGPRPAAGRGRVPAPLRQHSWQGQQQQPPPLTQTVALGNFEAHTVQPQAVHQELNPAGHAQQLPPIPQVHAAPQLDGGRGRQGAIETKMSLPRPAAVSQWLEDQGEVDVPPARGAGIVAAITALAAICGLGLISLIFYKIYFPVPAAAAPATQLDASK